MFVHVNRLRILAFITSACIIICQLRQSNLSFYHYRYKSWTICWSISKSWWQLRKFRCKPFSLASWRCSAVKFLRSNNKLAIKMWTPAIHSKCSNHSFKPCFRKTCRKLKQTTRRVIPYWTNSNRCCRISCSRARCTLPSSSNNLLTSSPATLTSTTCRWCLKITKISNSRCRHSCWASLAVLTQASTATTVPWIPCRAYWTLVTMPARTISSNSK